MGKDPGERTPAARKRTQRGDNASPVQGQAPLGNRPSREDPDQQSTDEERAGAIPELLRRAIAMGFAGFFTTEEAVRKALGDTLPQDWIDFAAEQSNRARSEVTDRATEEFGRLLENMDLAKVLETLLEGRTIEVEARIRLAPRDEARNDEPGKWSFRLVDERDDER